MTPDVTAPPHTPSTAIPRLIRLERVVHSSWLSVLLLIAVNAIPLVGVLYLGWDIFTLLILYWIESGVVGIINVAKMARAEGSRASTPSGPFPVRGLATTAPKGCLIPFFILHYGIFWLVHGVFVLLLPIFVGLGGLISRPTAGLVVEGPRISAEGIVVATLALIASHAVSFYVNFVRGGEYRTASPGGLMLAPYGRVVVLHVTILLGSMLVFALGQPVALLLLLVVLKTALDLILHVVSHRRIRAGSLPAGSP